VASYRVAAASNRPVSPGWERAGDERLEPAATTSTTPPPLDPPPPDPDELGLDDILLAAALDMLSMLDAISARWRNTLRFKAASEYARGSLNRGDL